MHFFTMKRLVQIIAKSPQNHILQDSEFFDTSTDILLAKIVLETTFET